MISSEPDPERTTPRQTTPQRPIVSISWTPGARTEYSRLAAASNLASASLLTSASSTRAVLNAAIKRAIFQTLQDAPAKMAALLDLQNPLFSIDVSIVGDGEIQELNFAHRNKNKPTDVLSFSQMEGEWMPFVSLENGAENDAEILLGDLVISIETAVRQAGELKHDLKHEIAFLTAHGVLHLLGYDHDIASRRRAMFAMQDGIVAKLESAPKSASKKPTIFPVISLC